MSERTATTTPAESKNSEPPVSTEPPAQAEGVRSLPLGAFRWYLAGFSLIGLLTGFFSGFSDSPITATVIPLLFTLITGAGGAYLASVKLERSVDIDRFAVVGRALVLFSVSCLVAAVYGMLVRTSAPVSSLVPQLRVRKSTPVNLPDKPDQTAEDVLELVLLRAQLNMLQIPPEEQNELLPRYAAKVAQPSPAPGLRPPSVALADLSAAVAALGAGKAKGKELKLATPDGVLRVEYVLRGSAGVLERWLRESALEAIARSEAYGALLAEIVTRINNLSDDAAAMKWSTEVDLHYDSVFALAHRLTPPKYGRQRPSTGNERDVREEILKTLAIARGSKDTPPAESRPSIRP